MRIVGHRGQVTSGGPPENTLAAVRAALAAGADGVEVDVRLTADGVGACVHDADLSRIAGRPERIAQLRWRQLRSVALPGGHRVASLAQVAALTGDRAGLVVDVKADAGRPDALAQVVVEALDRGGGARHAVVSSVSTDVLDAVRRLDPRPRRALIVGSRAPLLDAWRRVVDTGHHDLHPHYAAVFAEHSVGERAAEAGMVLRCWTVNRPVDARLLHVLGISEIITDTPGALRAYTTSTTGSVSNT